MQNEPPLHSGPFAPTTVFQPMTAMAMTGTISSSEFSALKAGQPRRNGRARRNAAHRAEEDQRPKREQRVEISLQRTPGEFRQEIKRRADADEARPEENQIVAEPPRDDGLHHAAHRPADDQNIGGRINPREQNSAAIKNQCDGNMPPSRRPEKFIIAHKPSSRYAKNSSAEPPRGNSSHANPVLSPTKIPTSPTSTPRCQRCAATTGTMRSAQRHLAEARENPERNAKSGRNAKTVEQRVIRRRLEMAVSHPRTIAELVRHVKSERGGQRQHRADDEPQRRAAEQHEQRHAARGVNLIGLSFVHGHSKALGLGAVFGSGAAAFSARAIKSARAAAGFCAACA